LFPETTPKEACNRLADYFSEISTEFQPVSLKFAKTYFPAPMVTTEVVIEAVRRMKESRSTCEKEIPQRLIRENLAKLAPELAVFFTRIFLSDQYPKPWKTETTIPIPKKPNPSELSDLRNISLTPFISKVCERIMLDCLTPYLEKSLSVMQFGSRKGTSTEHLVTYLLDVASDATDDGTGVAIVTSLDFSKAFNRISHDTLIGELIEIGTEAWLVKLIESYLSQRFMKVRIGDCMSDQKPIPGGAPQGSLLGVSLFILYVNEIAELGNDKVKCIQYVDDTYIVETVSQKNQPFLKHIGCGSEKRLIPLEGSQDMISKIERVARSKLMKLNGKKTNVMIVLPQRAPWEPVFELDIGDDVVSESQKSLGILGMQLSRDLSTAENTDMRVKVATSRIWLINYLKERGVEKDDLVSIYTSLIWSVMEYGLRCFGPMMSGLEISRMERVQRLVLRGVFDWNLSYEDALKRSGLATIKARCEELSDDFGNTFWNSEALATRLHLRENYYNLRGMQLVQSVKCRTSRSLRTPLNVFRVKYNNFCVE
jgi:hypothetical protein